MTDIERVIKAALQQFPLSAPVNQSGAVALSYAVIADLSEAGLVIIPRPATTAMRDAGLKAWRSSRDKHEEQLLMDVHDAMIAAHTSGPDRGE